MTDPAELLASGRHPVGIEAGAVRIDPKAGLGGVAAETRRLVVAGRTSLQLLASGLAMGDEPIGHGVVEGATRPTTGS